MSIKNKIINNSLPNKSISDNGPVSDGCGHGRSMGNIRMAMLGGCFILNSYLLEKLFPGQFFSQSLSSFIGAVILASPIMLTVVKDVCSGKIYMNELVAIAILASLANGDFRMAGLIGFFLLMAIIVETKTANGAQDSISALIGLMPHSARKILDGTVEEVDVSSLADNDVINIRPGDNFPVDGIIEKGESTVNQASITGESVPVDKIRGDEVYAGTQNLTGNLNVRVTRTGDQTTLGKVKEMILQAENTATPVVRVIDKYAGYYTPLILMIAAVTWLLTQDLYRVVTLMVIACPCTIVLATPTAIVAAVSAAARQGILIKNISHLELAGKIKTFIFDKTGTLTEGLLSVVKLSPVETSSGAELLLAAASAEQHSNHPTAIALQKLATDAEIKLQEPREFIEVHGKGVKAVIDSDIIYVGREKWIENMGIKITAFQNSETENLSIVYVVKNDKILGWVGFKDKIREEAGETILSLRNMGAQKIAMITGDRSSVAENVAAKLRVDEFRGDCLPETKVDYVENAKKSSLVAFIGDGINDAPALTAGNIGIAMGAIASDIAVNSASVALMTNDLRKIISFMKISKKVTMIINQNLIFGILFVLSGIVLSVFGKMSPVTAAILHMFSTLVVIFNSARLIREGDLELTRER